MERLNNKEYSNIESNSLRELLQQKQIELDQTLLDLGEELELWNLRLEHVANDPESTEESLGQLAQEAVMSLDQRWPFHGDKIHVTGRWLVADYTLSNDTMTFPMVEQDAFNIVNSNGFSVFEAVNGEPRVGLSFAYNQIPILSASIQGSLTMLTYANPADVSLYYVQPGDKESLKPDTSDLGDQITYYDQLLFLHYHNNKSEFYRKSARHQQQFLQRVTDTISESLPAPLSGYRAMCEQVEVPYVYRRVSDANGSKWQRVKARDADSMLLNGVVEGVGILETADLSRHRPLRNKQELVDPNAGICLILQVDQCSVPDIFNNQPVYVPLRLASDLELVVP